MAAMATLALVGASLAQPSLGQAALAAPPLPLRSDAGQLGGMVRALPGDSALLVARRCGVSVGALLRGNGLSPGASLWPGRILWLPSGSVCSAERPLDDEPREASANGTERLAATSASAGQAGPGTFTGDSNAAADRRAADYEQGLDSTPANGLATSGANPLQEPAEGTYVVRPGDTLSTIAERFGTTVAALQAWNDLASDLIWAGQILVVSGDAANPWSSSSSSLDGLIVVDVSEQRMTVYAGDRLLWSFVVSTGMTGHPTRRGTFHVLDKIPNAWSTAWQLWMPYWLGIYWAGGSENGIHALPVANGQTLWAGLLGSPVSYGCIVLDTADAARLYEWAAIGTAVIVRD